MTIAADAASLREPSWVRFKRWGFAFVTVLIAEVIAVAGTLYLRSLRPDDGPPPAPIMLTLAPLPVAPSARDNDLPPGPQQVEAEPEPQIEKPKPEKIVEAKDALIPEPAKRPKPDRKRDKPAPVTTAPQAAPNVAPVAAAPVAGVSAREADAMATWEAQLRAHLERYKRYPRDARMRGEAGEAVLRFVIDRDGHVLSSAVTRSSGFATLDDETLEMLRRATPLPPMPPEIQDPQKVFTIPVQFGLH